MSPTRLFLIVLAFALVGASVWVMTAYRRDMAVAREHASLGSTIAQTPCGPIEYGTSGDGPPVLVVHGAGGGFDQGLMLGKTLHGFRIIAPSRFGYLRTPLPEDASPEAQADAHACLLDSLGVQQAAVVGVSAGGPSTMQLCLRHPERCSAMVLLVPMAWSERPAQAERLSRMQFVMMTAVFKSDFAYWSATRLFRGAMIESILGTPVEDITNSSDRHRVDELLALLEPMSWRRQGLRNEQVIAQSLRRYPLEDIAVPTLVASVENCGYHTYEPARYTAEHIRGAKFIGYPRGGHLWLGHDVELAAEVQRFISLSTTTPAAH